MICVGVTQGSSEPLLRAVFLLGEKGTACDPIPWGLKAQLAFEESIFVLKFRLLDFNSVNESRARVGVSCPFY